MRFWIFLISMILAGCSSHTPQSNGRLSDSAVVVAQLNKQLRQWHRTPYRHGGLDKRGIDCSGFVYRTFRDRFNTQLPRTTEAQTKIGTQIPRDELMPGDLIFFKTGSGRNGLHVGIYDANDLFIHASTSKGVIRSSLKNTYWKRAYWHARRI